MQLHTEVNSSFDELSLFRVLVGLVGHSLPLETLRGSGPSRKRSLSPFLNKVSAIYSAFQWEEAYHWDGLRYDNLVGTK